METIGNKNADVAIHKPVGRVAQWVSGESASHQLQSLGPTWCKERNDSCGLSSDLQMGTRQAGVGTCNTHTHTHTPIKRFVFI